MYKETKGGSQIMETAITTAVDMPKLMIEMFHISSNDCVLGVVNSLLVVGIASSCRSGRIRVGLNHDDCRQGEERS